MYRTLDAGKIVATTTTLEQRIGERFPKAGLRRVAGELIDIAREAEARVVDLQRPSRGLRATSAVVFAVGLATLILVAASIKVDGASTELFGMMQGIDAAVNLAIVVGAAVLFLVTLESRRKRARALGYLHELRAIIHVIDMHQLTKDPSTQMEGAKPTAHSPARTLTAFELTRYLDYCTELLSLSAKVAALYAQSTTDTEVIDAVNDLERLTSNLSAKIWQKITLIDIAHRPWGAVAAAPHPSPQAMPPSKAAAAAEDGPALR